MEGDKGEEYKSNQAIMESVMNAINDYYMGSDECEKRFDEFASKHLDKFEDGFEEYDGGHEGKLEYTIAYKEFQEHYEKELEDLITKAGVEPE